MNNVNNDKLSENMQLKLLTQIPLAIISVDNSLTITYVNNEFEAVMDCEANEIYGKNYTDVFGEYYDNQSAAIEEVIRTGRPQKEKIIVSDNNILRDAEVIAVPYFDEENLIVGGIQVIFDISEDMARWNKMIEQSRVIQEMATPTIKLWDDVLLLPIVGLIDSERAQGMMENILNKIAETYSKVIILDIHGVAAVDTAVANHLIKITVATNLMGCECILSGISPAVAQAIIELGIRMEGVNTKANLSDALEEAFMIINKKVVSFAGNEE